MKPLIDPDSQNKEVTEAAVVDVNEEVVADLNEDAVSVADTDINEDSDDNDSTTSDLKEVDITLDNNDEMLEIDTLDINDNDTITLKKPDEVYKDLYKGYN